MGPRSEHLTDQGDAPVCMQLATCNFSKLGYDGDQPRQYGRGLDVTYFKYLGSISSQGVWISAPQTRLQAKGWICRQTDVCIKD